MGSCPAGKGLESWLVEIGAWITAVEENGILLGEAAGNAGLAASPDAAITMTGDPATLDTWSSAVQVTWT